MSTASASPGEDVHRDPRAFLERGEQLVNDPEGQLREAAALATKRDQDLNAAWDREHQEPSFAADDDEPWGSQEP